MKPVDDRFVAVLLRNLPADLDPAVCWPYGGTIHHTGYGQVSVRDVGRVLNRRAHRVAYAHYVGAIPEGALVLHSCDNPPCVNPAHLRLGTRSDNVRDALARGRWPQKDARRRLSDDDVRAIRRRLAEGAVQDRLAAEYGVAQSVVSAIKLRLIHRSL